MLSYERLRELLRYDPDTGKFFWRRTRPPMAADREAGHFLPAGSKRRKAVVRIGVDGKIYPRARLAWLYVTETWPIEIDHINGNPTDDRFDNLRNCTRKQNEANRGARKNNKLGYKGIVFTPSGKYEARVWRGHWIQLGRFLTLEAAKTAYDQAVKQHDGEFFHP